MKEASDRVASKQAPSVFVALKQIGQERKLDLSQFFPEIRLEASLKNIDEAQQHPARRTAQALQGPPPARPRPEGRRGVHPRSEREGGGRDHAARQRAEAEQGDRDHLARASTASASAEPIVRPVGNNRIEVQLPGVTTKDNPEIVSSLKKPARLDFRLVYPDGTPETIPASEAPPGLRGDDPGAGGAQRRRSARARYTSSASRR